MKKNKINKKRSSYKDAIRAGFEPLESIDLNKIKSFYDLTKAMTKTSFGGRQLGEAVEVLYQMITDKDCFVVGTFAGAMTPAKMGLLICEMIDRKMLDAIVATGALITHGLVENVGMTHFKYKEIMDDNKLNYFGYDRIYDTLELEENLDNLEEIVHKVFGQISQEEILSSHIICHKIGEYLARNIKGRGILKSAFKKGIPVYIPAFTDCKLGMDFALFNRMRKINGKKPLEFNPFLDLEHFADLILEQKKLGIFTVGGGVPRNWAQQVGPYLDLIRFRIIEKSKMEKWFPTKDSKYYKRYQYGVRICPEPVHWGGLSGCTYSEGISWGKMTPPEEGGRFAEVLADATIVWPIILKAVLEKLEKKR